MADSTKEINPTDPIGSLLQADPAQGHFELSPDGYYERWVPSDEEASMLGWHVYNAINNLATENAEVFDDIATNIEAYQAKDQMLGGSDDAPVMILPQIAREMDQLISFEVLTLMTPRPIVSVDPYFEDTYPMLSQQPDPMTGELPVWDSEEVAATLEFGLDYKLREQIKIRKLLSKISYDLKTSNYAIVKVVWDKRQKLVRGYKVKKTPDGFITVDGQEDRIVADGDPAKILNVNPFAFLAPTTGTIQDAELICELTPMSSTELRERLSNGDFFLIPPEQWPTLITKTTDNYRTPQEQNMLSRGRGIRMVGPGDERHDTREVWFEWPIRVTQPDPVTGAMTTSMQRIQLCGTYHMGMMRFLDLYRNPYHHGKRPYVLITEDPDGMRRPSLSLIGRTRKHQALTSQMLHLNIANQIQANNFDIGCNPDSDAWAALQSQKRTPGRLIPLNSKDDIVYIPVGANRPGLNQEIGFVMDDMSKTTGVSAYEQGMSIPGRTPADTVRQVMNAGQQRPLMTLCAISEGVDQFIRMYLEVLRQFEPFGEMVPTKDPETREKLMIPMRFPVNEVLDNFRIALTAADEELAKEADQEQRIMMYQTIVQANQSFAQMAGAMADVNASPGLTQMFESLFESQLKALELVIEPIRRDTKKFVPSLDIVKNLLMEKAQNVQAAMMQQQQQAQQGQQPGQQSGGGNGSGSTGGGGSVPQGNAGGGSVGGVGAAPANAGSPQGAAPSGATPPVQ